MDCEVVISGAEGVKSVSSGRIDFTDGGFDLDYDISGDRCRLTVHGGTLTQSRRGRVENDLTLSRGKKTVCMLLSGELEGEVPVRTVSLEWHRTDEGAELSAHYFLAGAEIFLFVSVRLL